MKAHYTIAAKDGRPTVAVFLDIGNGYFIGSRVDKIFNSSTSSTAHARSAVKFTNDIKLNPRDDWTIATTVDLQKYPELAAMYNNCIDDNTVSLSAGNSRNTIDLRHVVKLDYLMGRIFTDIVENDEVYKIYTEYGRYLKNASRQRRGQIASPFGGHS